MIDRAAHIVIPPGVLAREVDGEAVLLHLDTESYFGLDAVGTRMWKLLTTCHNVDVAERSLLDEYEVSPTRLAADLDEFIARLNKLGLVRVEVD
jgi:hypothetical protein